jgi:signal transduction histidine kinase
MTDRSANEPLDGQTIPAPAGPPASSERAAVWILDDSPMEAAMARRALASDYDVETFLDGSVLLERMAAGPAPSVLVLDWQLPGMSGIEVCRFLRSSRDETELPILMLTVFGHKTDLVDGLGAGANDYLTKPYDGPELAARVATLARLNALHRKVRLAERVAADLLARERKARAESEAANRTKDEFLAMVSHELRTPLNAILGWTRLLRSGDLPEDKATKALATVERNALAQTRLIDDLMDMSRVISGKLTIDREPVEVVSLIQSSVDGARPAAAAKGVTLHLAVDLDSGRVFGDGPRLEQVVGNLLTNAIKFTPKGGSIHVSLERVDDRVELSIVDSGSGIAQDFLPHVFERFRQADAGAARVKGGLGLGLAIVKNIVELHGGVVSAHSDGEGRGATFVVSLPSPADEPTARSAGSPSSLADVRASNRLAGLHLLIVDDDEDALYVLGTTLRQHGAEITSASSVGAAIDAIGRRAPDVLVSDIAMPDRDGYDLVRTLRASPDESARRLPSLALTAFAGPDDRDRALAAGFDMYASKPVLPAELVRSIARLAGRVDP